MALRLARDLVVHLKRPGAQEQYSEPLQFQLQSVDRFADLAAWILCNLGQDLSIEALSQRACMPCWKTLLNNTTFTVGCNNILGADPPKAFGTFKGNSNNYPGGLYDNLGRFWYVELVKRF